MSKLKTSVWQSFLIVLLGIVLGFAVNSASENPLPLKREPKNLHDERWPILAAEAVLQHVEEGTAILIDARDPNEYEAGHLPSAINLPEKFFIESFQEIGESLPREIPLVVYCQGGECDQSHQVLEQLSALAFQKLYLYPGGWNDWSAKEYPIEK